MIKIAKQLFQRPLKQAHFKWSQKFLTQAPNQFIHARKTWGPDVGRKKQIRVNLDFYTSENFRFSFIEMNAHEHELKVILRNLKSVARFEIEDIHRLQDLSLEVSSYITKNSQQRNKLLEENIVKYEVFMEKVKKNRLLIKNSEVYDEILSIIKKMLDKDRLDSGLDFNKFGPLSELLRILCVIDLGIWKQLIQYTFLYPEKFTDNVQLTKTLVSIKTFFSRFYFHENLETGFARHHFSFQESELSSLLNRQLVSSFFIKFDHYFVEKHEIRLANKNTLCVILSLTCDIIHKISKISFVNNFEERNYLKKFEPLLLDNLQELTPANSLAIFSNYVNLGLNNKEFVDRFTDYFLKLPSDVEMKDFLGSLLKSWRYSGKYDEEIYLKAVKRVLQTYVRNRKNLQKLPSIAFEFVMIKLKDKDIWTLVLDRLTELSFEQLFLFQKKSLHLVFQYLRNQKDIELDFKATLQLENFLSLFCISSQNNLDFRHFELPKTQEGRIDCCDKHNIMKYKTEYLEMINSSPNTKKESFTEQDYPPTLQEKMIKQAVEKYFPIFLGKPIKISPEHPLCLYKIDMALEIPDVHDKIALEISGTVYTYESGEMFGKKQIKFNLLQEQGWIPITINIGTMIPHGLMSFASQQGGSAFEKIAFIIYEVLRKEIKSRLNISLPEHKISKWTAGQSKDVINANKKSVEHKTDNEKKQ